MLAGESLTADETDALLELLRNPERLSATTFHRDLSTHQALRSLCAMESISDDASAEFASRLTQRIQMTAETQILAAIPAPPIVSPPPTLPPLVQQSDPTPFISPADDSAPMATGHWLLAIAASTLIASCVGYLWLSSSSKDTNKIAEQTDRSPVIVPETTAKVDKANPNKNNTPDSDFASTNVLPNNAISDVADADVADADVTDADVTNADITAQTTPPIRKNLQNEIDIANHPHSPAVRDDAIVQTTDQHVKDLDDTGAMQKPTLQSTKPVDSGSSATILLAENARWGEGGKPSGDFSDPIELISGKASIRLAQGAVVQLSGPTQLQIDGPNQAELVQGSVQVRVPEEAVGFQITARGARIVDLGTEFSVTSNPDSHYTVVRVTEGVVEAFQKPLKRRGRERKTRLVAGRAKWFPTEGQAYDWLLRLKLAPDQAKPEIISIDDQDYRLHDQRDRTAANAMLDKQLDFAAQQIELMGRGERFTGLVLVDDIQQKFHTVRQLIAVRSFLTSQLQKRSSNATQFASPVEWIKDFQSQFKDSLRTNNF